MRNLIVFAAMMRTNQTQHCLKIGPILLKGVFWHGRCLSRCFVEKGLQTVTIIDARFCLSECPRKRLAAKGGFAVRAQALNSFSTSPRLGLGMRFGFCLFHRGS